jgi:N-dimethylarginine dimethylaminohydrolase
VLRRRLDVEVVSLRLVDERFYHLDTCFCPLEGGFVMYYPPAFDEESNRIIERGIDAERRIAVGDADAIDFACNAVNIGHAVLLNRASADLKKRLSACGLTTIEVEMTEFLKAGGAAKCLTLRLDEPRMGSNEVRRTA